MRAPIFKITEADKWKTPKWVSGSAEVLFQPMLLLVNHQREERRTVWSLQGYIHNVERQTYWPVMITATIKSEQQLQTMPGNKLNLEMQMHAIGFFSSLGVYKLVRLCKADADLQKQRTKSSLLRVIIFSK